ncbi:pirin protein [Baffinella frigidus]|nr:pirin protein [Cryptophyta sp. CCMP2293]
MHQGRAICHAILGAALFRSTEALLPSSHLGLSLRRGLHKAASLHRKAGETMSGSAFLATCSSSRRIVTKFTARTQKEGAGFLVRRPIGSGQITDEQADPFLLLDHLPRTNYAPGEFPGAPWHPHRGFDTVMYLLEGQGSHEDSMGNKGTLYAGDCQWMTAGSGIQHNEGTGHPGGWMHGFQCWINLPKADKMCPPAYQDIRAASIPEVQCTDTVSAKVIAGTCAGADAVCQTRVPVQYLDFRVKKGGSFEHTLDPELATAICYVYKGSGKFGPDAVKCSEGDTLLLSEAGSVAFSADEEDMGFLLLAGRPIREPIARYGPFVMNTDAEIQQAIADYQAGTLCQVKGTYVAK